MPPVLILEVRSGPAAGRSFAMEAGAEAIAGRSPAGSQISLAGDFAVSRRHFAVQFDGLQAQVRDLHSTHGTAVNGSRIDAAVVGPGALIGVGETLIRVLFADAVPPHATLVATRLESADVLRGVGERPAAPAAGSVEDRLIAILQASRKPLYAVLDAARGEDVYRGILACADRSRCLFDEPRASELAAVAPYLVELPKGSPTLKPLVREGWGRAWGVYLTSDRGFHELREGLLRLATTTTAFGCDAVFRFYDPRVLRSHLPAGDPPGVAYFRDVASFFCEREDGGVDRYHADRGRLEAETFPLVDRG